MMSRVFCFLALLLSVVFLGVTAVASSSSSLTVDSGVPCPPETNDSGEGNNCSPTHSAAAKAPTPNSCTDGGSTGGSCAANAVRGPAGPAGERGEPGPAGAGATTCPDGNTANPNCPKDPTLRNKPLEEEAAAEASHGHGAARGVGAPSIGPAGEADRAGAQADQEIPDPRREQEAAAPTDTAMNPEAPASAPDTGISSNNEGSESETSQPPSSSNDTTTAGDAGSNPASTEPDNTPSGSESTGSQEGDMGNTDTTTTTTKATLPPEPANNNKKGDADSSSSISSYVWVRVPLLIVVTLACILVC
ncbi:uncharacterized protein TM35_000521060 [Trypanosoma theileri]|uniref:Uncharacterized protein n=1 Tax=Trypanosoma theileri TaxID=67003 RepID=A0A1X0NGT4_9TRYP|nr:uncharacterized protein TM35_000521060 [Trypanosoma theileri]ORC83962.1 hypothetical protein TM35_000521060 [Trypanosoma theileri]